MAAVVGLCLWVVAAWLLQSVLTPRQSWPAAYVLIAVGAALLVWLWLEAGIGWVLLGAGVMALVLRWPLIRGARLLRRWLAGSGGRAP